MIRGTVRCDRVKHPDRAACACGWSVPAVSQRDAKRRLHSHLRAVKASLAAGYRGPTDDLGDAA